MKQRDPCRWLAAVRFWRKNGQRNAVTGRTVVPVHSLSQDPVSGPPKAERTARSGATASQTVVPTYRPHADELEAHISTLLQDREAITAANGLYSVNKLPCVRPAL